MPRTDFIDVSSNESSPIQNHFINTPQPLNSINTTLITTLDTTLALTIPPPTSIQTIPTQEPMINIYAISTSWIRRIDLSTQKSVLILQSKRRICLITSHQKLAAIQAQLNNLGREVKKVNEKVYAAQVEFKLCKGPHYTKDYPLKEEGNNIEEAYYTQFGAPYQPAGQYRAAGPGFYQRNNGNSSPLQDYCCDDWREAQDVKILEAYDHTLPRKEKDPGSFTLPCFIHNVCFGKALVDLGASMSVMPFSTYTNLGQGILSHTRLTIELADRTIKQPRGIAKNVLVRSGKFIFPIDFIILYIPEDDDDKDGHEGKSLARTLIDIPIFVGKYSILVGFIIIDDEDVTRNVVLGMPFFMKYVSCQMIMKKFTYGDRNHTAYPRVWDTAY
nr:hypothetical protein [Tanacetum cinerariifolium]